MTASAGTARGVSRRTCSSCWPSGFSARSSLQGVRRLEVDVRAHFVLSRCCVPLRARATGSHADREAWRGGDTQWALHCTDVPSRRLRRIRDGYRCRDGVSDACQIPARARASSRMAQPPRVRAGARLQAAASNLTGRSVLRGVPGPRAVPRSARGGDPDRRCVCALDRLGRCRQRFPRARWRPAPARFGRSLSRPARRLRALSRCALALGVSLWRKAAGLA